MNKKLNEIKAVYSIMGSSLFVVRSIVIQPYQIINKLFSSLYLSFYIPLID